MSTDTKNFFLFSVDFPELLSCLCFTKRGLPFVFAPKNPHHRLPEILRWYACGADGRSGGRSVYGHVITKFSRMGSLPHFVTHGAPLRASRARAPLLISPRVSKLKRFHSRVDRNKVSIHLFWVRYGYRAGAGSLSTTPLDALPKI